jgi:hypothetical protein
MFAVGIPTGPEVAAKLHHELTGLQAALAPWANGRHYGKLPGAAAPAEQFFDRDTLGRLRSITDRWDPAHLLHANHSVR